MGKIKTFIIDDSAIVRSVLTEKLGSNPEIEVVGSALDPYIAREKMEKIEVDVITLDIEMPRMDGLTFLKYLMKYRPIPVIIVSSLSERGNKASMEALELGAIDIVPKPGGPLSIDEVVDILTEKILMTRELDYDKFQKFCLKNSEIKDVKKDKILSRLDTTDKLIAVGASTGGTQALEILFKGFEVDCPPTLAVIHMPPKFTFTFANRLNDICKVKVKEASDG
ncbi:MAG TPA: response regulator, partial [Spirochaetota bacterium]|nr:response regulator [Spirochaetota bacterium]